MAVIRWGQDSQLLGGEIEVLDDGTVRGDLPDELRDALLARIGGVEHPNVVREIHREMGSRSWFSETVQE